MLVENVVVKENDKYYVKSKEGKNLGGPYDTEEEAKKRLKQVEAFKHMKKNSFQEITFNIKPKVRHDVMEGKPYMVVPMIMMTEGVLNGSNGALLYPAEELAKLPVVWNHKPVVVYHPSNGSACSPDVLSARKVGVIMNTVFEDNKLKAEAWLEESRLKTVDERILTAINENKMMEVSTGLFTDNESMEGVWGDKPYEAIARNYKPDHLAILPDLKGACSIEDGAGLLRLNEEKKDTVINGRSFNQIRDLLDSELQKTKKGAWVSDVFDSYFVYSMGNILFKLNYSIKKDVLKIEGIPVEVVRSVEYKTKNGKSILNLKKDYAMNKEQLIESLISNKATKWEESDKEFLMAQDDAALEKMIPIKNEKTKEEIAAEEEAAKTAEEKKKKEEEKAAASKNEESGNEKETAQSFIEKAPKEIQDVLTNGLNTYNKEKARLVGFITSNKKNTFTKEQLESKNVDELKAIAKLAADENQQKEANYNGQLDAGDIDLNEEQEEPLKTPVMNFDKK